MGDAAATKVELARLRGGIEGGNVGSRGLAAHLASPCERARTLIAVGTSPSKAAETTHGVTVKNEPSRIAAEVGQIFERVLVGRGGERLINLYLAHPDPAVRLPGEVVVLECGNEEFDEVDVALRMQKFAQASMDMIRDAHGATRRGQSIILLQPTLELSINGYAHYVRPDLLVCTDGMWHVGEIKVYLDRDGETSGIEVSSTVRQAAVGVLAARTTLHNNGLVDVVVSSHVDIVFRKHALARASLTRLSAEAEIESLSAGIDSAVDLLIEWKDKLVSLDTADAIEQIPNFYSDSCAKSCAYNEVCRSAKEHNDGRILHDHPGVVVVEVSGVTGTRALELAAGADPLGRNEAMVARWVRAGWETGR